MSNKKFTDPDRSIDSYMDFDSNRPSVMSKASAPVAIPQSAVDNDDMDDSFASSWSSRKRSDSQFSDSQP